MLNTPTVSNAVFHLYAYAYLDDSAHLSWRPEGDFKDSSNQQQVFSLSRKTLLSWSAHPRPANEAEVCVCVCVRSGTLPTSEPSRWLDEVKLQHIVCSSGGESGRQPGDGFGGRGLKEVGL